MSSAFSNCPTEVWQQIFDEACKDNGKTACALSATSRTFRRLSSSHKFYSIGITSKNQLYKVLATLDQPLQPGQAHTLTVKRAKYLSVHMARTPTDYDNRHLVALYDLLQFVSPTLEVLRLCYVAKCTRSFEDQFPRLPKLRELSVHFMELSFVGPGPRYLRDSDSDSDSDDENNSDFDDFDDEEEKVGSTFPLLDKFDVFGVLHFSPFRYWDTLESAAPLLEGLTVPRSQVSHLCRVNEHFGFVVGDESESEKDALREVNASSAWLNNTRTDRRFMAINLHDEACGVCLHTDRRTHK